jgi:hypothetical protein
LAGKLRHPTLSQQHHLDALMLLRGYFPSQPCFQPPHAGLLVGDLDKLRTPYMAILDNCYKGKSLGFESQVLTATASKNLTAVKQVLRHINEFHQPNPVLFSTIGQCREGGAGPGRPEKPRCRTARSPGDPDSRSLGA